MPDAIFASQTWVGTWSTTFWLSFCLHRESVFLLTHFIESFHCCFMRLALIVTVAAFYVRLRSDYALLIRLLILNRKGFVDRDFAART